VASTLAGNFLEPATPRIREKRRLLPRNVNADEVEGIAPPPPRKRQLTQALVPIHSSWVRLRPSQRALLHMCGRGASISGPKRPVTSFGDIKLTLSPRSSSQAGVSQNLVESIETSNEVRTRTSPAGSGRSSP